MITQERLRELLSYCPETGIFIRRVRMANRAAGTVAGSLRDTGYISISIDGRACRAQHLAWLYMTGLWPAKFIDHRDTDKANNRWENLREATKSQNQANIGIIKSNASGLKGASRYRAGEKAGLPWQAGIGKDGRIIYLGHFRTKEEAAAAYRVAAEKLFGEFARVA